MKFPTLSAAVIIILASGATIATHNKQYAVAIGCLISTTVITLNNNRLVVRREEFEEQTSTLLMQFDDVRRALMVDKDTTPQRVAALIEEREQQRKKRGNDNLDYLSQIAVLQETKDQLRNDLQLLQERNPQRLKSATEDLGDSPGLPSDHRD